MQFFFATDTHLAIRYYSNRFCRHYHSLNTGWPGLCTVPPLSFIGMQMSKMKGQIQCRTPCFKWIYVYYYCFYIVVCSPGFTSAGVTILHFSSRCIFQNGRQLLLVIPNYSDLPKVKFVLCMCFVCLLHILLLYWPFYYILENSDQKKKSNCPYWQIRSQHNHIDFVFLKTNFNVSELSVASLFMGRAPWSFLLKLIGERNKPWKVL